MPQQRRWDKIQIPLFVTVLGEPKIRMSVTEHIIKRFERLGQLNIWSTLVLGLFFTAAALVVFPRTPLSWPPALHLD
jgi:hypothetical protein